jgi:hypothetical protein
MNERTEFMKNLIMSCGAAVAMVLAGCASAPVVTAPVGPNPLSVGNGSGDGQLEVFSALASRSEGDDPTWRQYSSFFLYNDAGHLVRKVVNADGYYSRGPHVMSLAAGRYLVKARAKDYLWVKVPVVIESGRMTEVHLNDGWHAPDNASESEVVSEPDGGVVGWRAGASSGQK